MHKPLTQTDYIVMGDIWGGPDFIYTYQECDEYYSISNPKQVSQDPIIEFCKDEIKFFNLNEAVIATYHVFKKQYRKKFGPIEYIDNKFIMFLDEIKIENSIKILEFLDKLNRYHELQIYL